MKALLLLTALASGSEAQPSPVNDTAIRPPADACFGHSRACAASVSISILPDGSVSDVIILRSSRDRSCDKAIRDGVYRWVFEPGGKTATIETEVNAYSCPLPSG